ncbi:putative leucine aminopeptidase 1 [Orchesella cincta]|uniref:Putative leucine aminopeptidase 1 n=1 Tax=Orchesella cincta TaxID=48709 RepID=A0A1D2MLX9_ORCCI|nr:putative leucine aminopeptidase 1 [Orchesella cincta]
MKTLQVLLIASFGVLLASTVPLGQHGKRRLIKVSEFEPPKWLNDKEIWGLLEKDIHFMDITDIKNFSEKKPEISQNKGIPTELKYEALVSQAFGSINLGRIETFIQTFSDFHNRYYDAENGVISQRWLLEQVKSSIRDYAGNVSVIEIEHDWLQNSIIARIDGADPTLRSQVVILGAHQDSINTNGITLRAPGADDNASGCITVLETLRAIVQNGIIPNRTVEFHWYAGEERGLLGSLDIAQRYKEANVQVFAMVNLTSWARKIANGESGTDYLVAFSNVSLIWERSGSKGLSKLVEYYVDGNDDIAIVTDYVDNELTQFLRVLIDGYLSFGRRERECGYACSDHAAWTQNGFPAARPTQAVRNGQMHTLNDTIGTVSFIQVREFVKLATGFLVELADVSRVVFTSN